MMRLDLDVDKVEATENLRQAGYDGAITSRIIIELKQRCSH